MAIKKLYKMSDNIYESFRKFMINFFDYSNYYGWLSNLEEDARRQIGVTELTLRDAKMMVDAYEKEYQVKIKKLYELIKYYYKDAERIDLQYDENFDLKREVIVWSIDRLSR